MTPPAAGAAQLKVSVSAVEHKSRRAPAVIAQTHRVTVSWMMMMMLLLKVTFATLNTLKLLKLDVCTTKVRDE